MTRTFVDRRDAGRQLAAALRARHWVGTPVVLGLPRGGVPVAAEIADALDAPLDVLVVRKVGAPFQPELALGAVGSGHVEVRNAELIAAIPDGDVAFERGARTEHAEVLRRERLFRGARPPLDLSGRTALLVDDGAATGATMRVAIRIARTLGAARVIVALPVASAEALDLVRSEADDASCLVAPHDFFAVGAWYADFPPIDESEVRSLLADAEARTAASDG